MDARAKMVAACKKHNKIAGVFLFGTDRVKEFIEAGFTMIAIGNDLHHVLTQSASHLKTLTDITKAKGGCWTPKPTALF